MTTRNLNHTWRDVVLRQYEEDHAADVPFPVRYLTNAPEWKKDISIEIPTRIDAFVFRQAVLHFCRTRRRADDPAYEDDLIKVRAHVPLRPSSSAQRKDDASSQTTLASLSLVLLATAANAWDFVIYSDGECERTPTTRFLEGGKKGINNPFTDVASVSMMADASP